MCRSIRSLHNFDPPATTEEIAAAALQYVRKVSGMQKPSKVNEAAFERAVTRISSATQDLLGSLETSAAPKNREVEAAKARTRAQARYGSISP